MENSPFVRVLVVEDNPFDQELLRRQLQKTSLGDNILFLSDPRAALDLLRGPEAVDFRRDLIAIFLDIHLPHLSGVELLQHIRAIDGMEAFPVIIMTTSPHPDTVAACTRLKAMAFMEKPITFPQFSKVIADIFHQPQLTPV